jgi:hypothetical protein
VPEKSDYYYDESTNPIEEICKYTDNLEHIPAEIRYQMLAEICRQKGSSVYGHYDAPPNKHLVAQINGQGGYFLKKTTTAANIYLIWYHPSKDRYLFWGPTEKTVRDAMNRIRGRIVKYVVHLDRPNETEEDVEEMDYVEPALPTIDEQYGKSSQKLMGRNQTGRTEPINPIKDLGGRMENRQFGLGYTKPDPMEQEHKEQLEIEELERKKQELAELIQKEDSSA